MKKLLDLLPGLVLALAISVPAIVICKYLDKERGIAISAAFVAIAAGVLIRNTFGLHGAFVPGNTLAVKKLLRLGIILLGIKLTFFHMMEDVGHALPVIVICITVAIVLVHLISVKIGLPPRLATLIGVGTSICGVSAIVATSPAIGAEEEETSFAVGTITLFGLLAVMIYPIIGHHLLGMNDKCFGTWAGTAVNDTSQVVATGKIFSEKAEVVATEVKMARNLFMAPVIVLLSLLYARKAARGAEAHREGRKAALKKAFPLFILGFVAMAVFSTFNHPDKDTYRFLSADHVQHVKDAASLLIVTALAGVGLQTNLAAMKRVGLKPLYAGLFASCLMAGVSYALITLFHIG